MGCPGGEQLSHLHRTEFAVQTGSVRFEVEFGESSQTIGSEIPEPGQELVQVEVTEGFHVPAPIYQGKWFGIPVLRDYIEPLHPGRFDMNHVGQGFDGRPRPRPLITFEPCGSQTVEVAAQHLGRTSQRRHRII